MLSINVNTAFFSQQISISKQMAITSAKF